MYAEHLLRAVPGLAEAPVAELLTLAGRCSTRTARAGETLGEECEAAERMYVIASGQAEVTAAGEEGPMNLALLGPGEVFGHLAIAFPGRHCDTTIRASTDLEAFVLERALVEEAVLAQPERRRAFMEEVESLLIARFIRSVSVFSTLDDRQRRWLAERARPRFVEKGDDIIREGEAGQTCFALRYGAAEVWRDGRVIGVLAPGSVVGEVALLTGSPRSATIRAVEDCELIELSRSDVLEIMHQDPETATALTFLSRLRSRPRRDEGVEVHERLEPGGERITTLRQPDRRTYYRLCDRGRFVWDRLDGTRDLRQLTLDYFTAFHEFAPTAVADVVAGLARAGMLHGPDGLILGDRRSYSRLATAVWRLRRLALWRCDVPHMDRFVNLLFARVVRHLYGTPGRVAVVVLAVMSVALAGAELAGGNALSATAQRPEYAALLLPGTLLTVAVHELGHAFTVRACGRSVPSGGFGLYWLKPIGFVDTSEMWLSPPRDRVRVSLAGPLASLGLGGLIALGAELSPTEGLEAALWALAVPAYASALINLTPALETDGYYVLSDLADRPRLRDEGFRWLRHGLPTALRDPASLRGHAIEIVYVVVSLLFLALLIAALVLVWREVLTGWLDGLIGGGVGAVLAWLLVIAYVGTVVVMVAEAMRAAAP